MKINFNIRTLISNWIIYLLHVILRYHKVASSRPVYYSILQPFDQRSQYISIKFPLHKQSENPWMWYWSRHFTAHDFKVFIFHCLYVSYFIWTWIRASTKNDLYQIHQTVSRIFCNKERVYKFFATNIHFSRKVKLCKDYSTVLVLYELSDEFVPYFQKKDSSLTSHEHHSPPWFESTKNECFWNKSHYWFFFSNWMK